MSNPIESYLQIQVLTADSDGNPAWADLISEVYPLAEVQEAFAALGKLFAEMPANQYRLVNVKIDLLASTTENRTETPRTVTSGKNEPDVPIAQEDANLQSEIKPGSQVNA